MRIVLTLSALALTSAQHRFVPDLDQQPQHKVRFYEAANFTTGNLTEYIIGVGDKYYCQHESTDPQADINAAVKDPVILASGLEYLRVMQHADCLYHVSLVN